MLEEMKFQVLDITLDWVASIQNIQVFYFSSMRVHAPLCPGYDEMLKFQAASRSSWEAMTGGHWQDGWLIPGGDVLMNVRPIWQRQTLERSGEVYMPQSCSIANTQSASKVLEFALRKILRGVSFYNTGLEQSGVNITLQQPTLVTSHFP